MRLSLKGVVPIPIREKIESRKSGLWKNSIVFNKGECLFVRAPSGTGKTTLIHILYGLRNDFEGDVTWNENPVATIDMEGLAELRSKNLSIIFQDLRLFPELTAWENIEIKRKLTDTISEQAVYGWMERLGILDKKNALAKTLSYGEQQRVAIIRALVQPFEWLLMDEPFSHLDNENIQKAVNLIQEVVSNNSAGMLLADLDENNYFNYTQTITL